MEILTQANGAKVFVDYAHNGDSLDKLLQVVTDHQKGKISLILGAPGNKGESVVKTLVTSSTLTPK